VVNALRRQWKQYHVTRSNRCQTIDSVDADISAPVHLTSRRHQQQQQQQQVMMLGNVTQL